MLRRYSTPSAIMSASAPRKRKWRYIRSSVPRGGRRLQAPSQEIYWSRRKTENDSTPEPTRNSPAKSARSDGPPVLGSIAASSSSNAPLSSSAAAVAVLVAVAVAVAVGGRCWTASRRSLHRRRCHRRPGLERWARGAPWPAWPEGPGATSLSRHHLLSRLLKFVRSGTATTPPLGGVGATYGCPPPIGRRRSDGSASGSASSSNRRSCQWCL